MTLNEYQKKALRTAASKEKHNEFFHLVLGLVGETGEIAEKVKKLVRDQNSDISKLDKKDIEKELGDVLWYVATLADFLDIKLEDIGARNIDKLASRQKRGKLAGSGDNR
ncbi:nucleoside triphosphate pyrophosphohydrolase family protein [Candidatus Saccharibacteria bacterium]|nr:nucleoside triphosphate pyrophosphohydrolase family protein [Candidatus Saccharibacteria bacterium]